MMERCDCLNGCGDDPRVAKGAARKCDRYDEFRAEEERRRAMQELEHALRDPANQELLANGLASIIRNYPEKTTMCRRMLSLVTGRLPPNVMVSGEP